MSGSIKIPTRERTVTPTKIIEFIKDHVTGIKPKDIPTVEELEKTAESIEIPEQKKLREMNDDEIENEAEKVVDDIVKKYGYLLKLLPSPQCGGNRPKNGSNTVSGAIVKAFEQHITNIAATILYGYATGENITSAKIINKILFAIIKDLTTTCITLFGTKIRNGTVGCYGRRCSRRRSASDSASASRPAPASRLPPASHSPPRRRHSIGGARTRKNNRR